MKDQWTDTLPGLEIRGFRFGRKVGSGPRAVVFEGEQLALKRTVALKTLRPELANDPTARKTFLEAGRAAAGLIHPNVIPIVNVIEDGSLAMIVSEYAAFPTVASMTTLGVPLAFQEICQMALHVLDVLRVIHAGGKRHGNICPENVFGSDDGRYRLSDFYQPPDLALRREGSWQRRSEYIAPEMRLGGAGDPSSDIYSLGMLLRHAASALPPGESAALNNVPPSFPPLLAYMTEANPQRRPAALERLLEAIRTIRAEARALGGAMAMAARADLPPPNRRRYHRLAADSAVSVAQAYSHEMPGTPAMESRLRDIGENGVFIATPDPMPMGSLVSLAFELEGAGRVQALGMVRWIARPPAESGMGVQFVEVAYPARESLTKYIDGRLPQEAETRLTATPAHRAVLKALPTLWSRPPSPLSDWVELTHQTPEALQQVLNDFIQLGLLRKNDDGRLETPYPTSRSFLQTLVRLADRF